ncbi:hypothetical protein FT663_01814 [Candidozyma haemuli var. vulneris]|uniref:Uncharacterized protein n=1 Tax=Candidozyma haemuli TaxID=45357 RepID=A0A2V1AYE7_9ASCO|nr:hypothetical protein CXQ85_002847 [[Candida] haemuloni]KAF3991064.1 hypothetical protein FT662_01892 [[Candida] haemuloni var. vulneris]KAF3993646.1 hypothetical protein FT663_01814 [[Candida] haemuloni var. vulneris]PVH23120.1 hypothetical protein CXQ85_002847 [[Candida] haemuloni]
MPSLHKQWSADDVSSGSSAINKPERRARSASPTKQRPLSHNFDFQSLLPSIGSPNIHDEIASKVSNGSLSPEQIRRLSRSPIAKKLHISSSQYALPIPFKLQLPPKLSTRSAPPSPEPSRGRTAHNMNPSEKELPASPSRFSPKKLVFNGAAYEAADSSESESELSFLKPSLPQKPPATMSNRRKVARFAQKHQSMPSDQLSMIEEASNAGSANSRASSLRQKELPTLPKTNSAMSLQTQDLPPSPTSQRTRNVSRKPPPELRSPMPVSLSKPELDLVPPPPPPIQLPTSASAPVLSEKAFESSADSSFNVPKKLETRVVTEAPRRRPDARLSQGEINVFPTTPEPTLEKTTPPQPKVTEEPLEMFPRTPVESEESEDAATPRSTLPHSHACHHNLNLGEESYLKIYKRSFSDESKVSSVSSFSSVGDALNLNHDPAMRSFNRDQTALSVNVAKYLRDNPTRGASIASSRSDASTSSWDSIQKSVDFSIRDSASASERSSLSTRSTSSKGKRDFSKELPPPPEELEYEDDSLNDQFEVPRELNISKKSSAASSVPVPVSKNVEGPIEQELDLEESATEDNDKSSNSLDDGNSGVGRGFSFPNDMSNITNSEEARKRLEQQRLQNTRVSRKSSRRSSRQIEIPNLDDLDSLSSYKISETRHNGVSFNDLQNVKLHGVEKDKDNASDIEPIGVPSQAAKKHFSSMYGSKDSSGSESDSSFESNAKSEPRKPLSSPAKQMPSSFSLGAIASRKSPIRHARHRSMYNFDFAELYQEPSPQSSINSGQQARKHKMSKSVSVPSEVSKEAASEASSHDRELTKSTPPVEKTQPIEEVDQSLNIVVAEPPKKVQYAVDFKDASSPKKPESAPFGNNFDSDYYHQSMKRGQSRRSTRPPSVQSQQMSGSSQSRFSDSLVTARETISTAPSDTDSITIDLTKEDYNVCMIKRNDSTLSYRSIIEKRNGKPVEVVLVEEDEEHLPVPKPAREDRDDLSSIYSRYMNDWDKMKIPARKNSSKSSTSEASSMSGSWANSETGFQVKTKGSHSPIKPQTHMRKATMPNLESFTKTDTPKSPSKRIQSTPKLGYHNLPNSDGSYNRGNSINYFDYNGTEKYDFESFMKQRL